MEKAGGRFEIQAFILGHMFTDEYGGDCCSISNFKTIINEAGIESYDWKKQELTLSKQASAGLKNDFGVSKSLDDLIQKFKVLLDGKEIYSGIITNDSKLLGKKAEFAVIVIKHGEKTTISVLPGFPKSIEEKSKVCKKIREKMQSTEIKEFFKKMGKLKE